MNVREAVDRVVAARFAGQQSTPSESEVRGTREEVANMPAVHRGDGCSPKCTGCLATIHYDVARLVAQQPRRADDAKWYQEYADALLLLHEVQRRENAGRDRAEAEAEP